MTPRKVILANLTGAEPARCGMDFSGGRWCDLLGAGVDAPAEWRRRVWTDGPVEYYDDEWGNVWRRMVGMSSGGEVFRPALTDWSDLPGWRMPDMSSPERFRGATAAFGGEPDRFRVAWLPGFPFAICRYLRQMETYFQDLYTERAHIDELHGRITDLLEAMIVQFAGAGADAIMFCEDWGIQNRLLVSPKMWRDVFKPLFARLCGAARGRGMHVIMHSCGYISDIIDDLAEVGVSALQLDQPALFGLEPLAKRMRAADLCLYAPVDIQAVLPTGDRQRIVDEAARMADLFAGRFIAKNYPDLHGIGVQPEWDGWAYDVFRARAEQGGA